MSKSDKVVLVGFGLAFVGAFAVNWATCRSRKGWYLEPGQPDECLPPAIRSGVMAGIFNALKVPQLMQLGIEVFVSRANRPTRTPDLIDNVTGEPIWLRQPEQLGDVWQRYQSLPS